MTEIKTKLVIHESGKTKTQTFSPLETNKLVIHNEYIAFNQNKLIQRTNTIVKTIGLNMALKVTDFGATVPLYTNADQTFEVPETLRNRKIWAASPRIENQEFRERGDDQIIPIRSKFIEETGIPETDFGGFVYWFLAQNKFWTDCIDEYNNFFSDNTIDEVFPEDDITTDGVNENEEAKKRYIPVSPSQFERMFFYGVDDNGSIDPDNEYPSFMKSVLEYHDDLILNKGYGKPNDGDMAILDFEFHAIFYCIQGNFLRAWRNDNYSASGNINAGGTIVSPCPGTTSKRYQINSIPHYPDDEWLDVWFPIVVNAYKRMAQIIRKRYGFTKVGTYGFSGGYSGWWEGLTESNDPPASPKTHRGWMRWTWRRIAQHLENEKLFEESTKGRGNYLDFITCQPKPDHPNDGSDRYWSFPISRDRGFEVVVREMITALRPWKDNVLLLVNPYYSFGNVDCTGNCLWDQAYGNNYTTRDLQVNYRQNPPVTIDTTNVDFPPTLNEEMNWFMSLYFKYAPDWDTYDFNFYWVDMERFTSLSPNSEARYWLLGYDGDFTQDTDYYDFLFLKLYCPWYRDLYKQYVTFAKDRRPMAVINYAAAASSGEDSRLDEWKINRTPTDSLGNPILQKSNPDTDTEYEDGILWIVRRQLEPMFQRGFRRFALRSPCGSRTGSFARGSGVPASNWSSANPNLLTWNDGVNIDFFEPGVGGIAQYYEYPFTSTGNLVSKDQFAVVRNRQQSIENFLKPWIESKAALNQPVDVYIYDGYQLAFFDQEQTLPAFGNLAIKLFQDNDWQNNPVLQLKFPIPDFSIESHVQCRDSEVLPWMSNGISGFVVDASGKALSSDRPPGYFDYYRERSLKPIGEAVPMINDNGTFLFDEEIYDKNAYMGYYDSVGSDGDFWGNRRYDDKTPSLNSELHIVLTWGYKGSGGWSKRYWNATTETYDIDAMKAEIDDMVERGYVVSIGFPPYHSVDPQVEFSSRLEIISYVAEIQSV